MSLPLAGTVQGGTQTFLPDTEGARRKGSPTWEEESRMALPSDVCTGSGETGGL